MSVCNYIQLLTPDTCLGDSLATFNSNFSALDEGLCRQPTAAAGPGIVINKRLSEQSDNYFDIKTKNSFAYSTVFDTVEIASKTTLPLLNPMEGIQFPRLGVDSINAAKPTVTFSTVSLTKNSPRVTIFWTASGTNNTTIYTTNSATSATTDIGSIGFGGGSIVSLLSTNNTVYVGGDFLSVGTDGDYRKICALSLNTGTQEIPLERAGTLVPSDLSSFGGFGNVGEIRSIIRHEKFLIFGGSYQSTKGRGLTIIDTNTNTIYPFYVNGEVNCLAVIGNYLYVGGHFDFVNYTERRASANSGLRTYTNGLIRIQINVVITFPNSSIDKAFGARALQNFNSTATINAIASKSGTMYIGGLFDIYQQADLMASNLAILNADGTTYNEWKPVVGGEIYTLAVDGDYLYVGGRFDYCTTVFEFFNGTTVDPSYNAACFFVGIPTSPFHEFNWKPVFNGSISSFCFHDQEFGTFVYCYGDFTNVNGKDVGYLAAVYKSYLNSVDGKDPVEWEVSVNKPPLKISNSMIRLGTSVLIGGTFDEINGVKRTRLGRVSGVFEELETSPRPTVVWKVGAQVLNHGSSLYLNTTNFASVTSYPNAYGNVNQTSFPYSFTSSVLKNASEGSLMKFSVQREGYTDSLSANVYVIGWKVDFN